MKELFAFVSDFFVLIGELCEKFSRLRMEMVKAKNEAQIKRLKAQAEAGKFRDEAKTEKWQRIIADLGVQVQFIHKMRAKYLRNHSVRKILLQRAKIAKWREFGKAWARFFAVFRLQLRRFNQWRTRKSTRAPIIGYVWFFTGKTAAVFCAVVFIWSISKHAPLVYSIVLLGIPWSLFGGKLMSAKGKLADLGKLLLVMTTVLWMGVWLIGFIAIRR